MMDRFDNIPETALAWHRAGRGAALATVVETWGSAPRRVGSQLAISGEGEIAGSVSGGCVEGAVVVEALDAMAEGRPVILEYGVSDGDAFAVGLACGGTIRVLVEPVGTVMPEALLAELVAARARRGGGLRDRAGGAAAGTGRARGAVSHGSFGVRGGWRDIRRHSQPALAPCRRRRGAYRAGAGADGAHRGL
jgi:xanthine/CO dehydrogenase XdhC/CoxF family maturation factor